MPRKRKDREDEEESEYEPEGDGAGDSEDGGPQRRNGGRAARNVASSQRGSATASQPPAASSSSSGSSAWEVYAIELFGLKNAELKAKLVASSLTQTGNKEELVSRLVKAKYPSVVLDTTRLKEMALKRGKVSVVEGNPKNWVRVQGKGKLRVLTLQDANREIFPELGWRVRDLHRTLSDNMQRVAYVSESPLVQAFCLFADQLARLVLDRTCTFFALNPDELFTACGTMFSVNLWAVSLERKFPREAVLADMTPKRFTAISNHITAYGALLGSRAESTSSWVPRAQGMRAWEDARAVVLQWPKLIASQPWIVSIDDDLKNFGGRFGPENFKLVVAREGEGQELDTATNVLGFVVDTFVREGGSNFFVREIEKTEPLAHAQVTCDRGYTSAEAMQALQARWIPALGLAGDRCLSDQPFGEQNLKSLPKLLDADKYFEKEDPFVVKTFVGAGTETYLARNIISGIYAVAVRQRGTRAAVPNVTRLLVADPRVLVPNSRNVDAGQLPSIDAHVAKDAETIVLIPAHVDRHTRERLLTRRASATPPDPFARRVLDALNELGARVVTEDQGDGAWATCRKGTLTALGAALIVPKVLKAYPGKYPRVEAALKGTLSGAGAATAALPEFTLDELIEPPAAVDMEEPSISLEDALAGQDNGDEEDDNEGEGHASLPQAAGPPLQAPAPTPIASPSTLDENLLTRQIFEAWMKMTMMSGFQGNEHTAEGALQEQRGDKWVLEVDCVRARDGVLKSGLVGRITPPYAAASPDMFLSLAKTAEGPVPDDMTVLALGEHKHSKYFTPNAATARTTVFAAPGSLQYATHVDAKFRAQLLHQCAVTGISHTLLIKSSPTGPSGVVQVAFSTELLNEYRELLDCTPLRRSLGMWHEAMASADADTKVSDKVADALKLPPASRYTLQSQTPVVRALLRYVEEKQKPLSPVAKVRPFFIHKYDVTRGFTDNLGRELSDVTRAGSTGFRHKLDTKLTWALFNYAAVNAIRAVQLVSFVNGALAGKTSAQQDAFFATLDVADVRAGMRDGKPFADWMQDLSVAMLRVSSRTKVAFGGLKINMSSPPRAPHSNTAIDAAYPDKVKSIIDMRAATRPGAKRVDFFYSTRLPTADYHCSPTTPGNVIGMEYWKMRADSMNEAFLTRPQVRESDGQRGGGGQNRSSRKIWWETTGCLLRSCPELLHAPFELEERRPCVWCEVPRSRQCLSCVLCGEVFCGLDCYNIFHAAPRAIPKVRKSSEAAAAAAASGPGTQLAFGAEPNASSAAASTNASASAPATAAPPVAPTHAATPAASSKRQKSNTAA